MAKNLRDIVEAHPGRPGGKILSNPKAQKQHNALTKWEKRFKAPTAEQRAKREKARERHWHRTGVSSATTKWMKDSGFL